MPSAKIQGEKSYSIVSDYLGTPCQAYDANGAKVWEYEQKSYGGVETLQGAINFIPFRYQGQYEDVETGLYYNRFRYYSPEEGSYISQDPIGLDSGEFNLYNYVYDTNGWIDVFGLTLSDNQVAGALGETNSGIKKNTKRIPAPSGKKDFRIPDAMTKNGRHIKEVKNVDYQHLSSQLEDDLAHVNRGGKKGKVTLIVDNRTKLS